MLSLNYQSLARADYLLIFIINEVAREMAGKETTTKNKPALQNQTRIILLVLGNEIFQEPDCQPPPT